VSLRRSGDRANRWLAADQWRASGCRDPARRVPTV